MHPYLAVTAGLTVLLAGGRTDDTSAVLRMVVPAVGKAGVLTRRTQGCWFQSPRRCLHCKSGVNVERGSESSVAVGEGAALVGTTSDESWGGAEKGNGIAPPLASNDTTVMDVSADLDGTSANIVGTGVTVVNGLRDSLEPDRERISVGLAIPAGLH